MNIKKHIAASTHMIVDPIVKGAVTVTDSVAKSYQEKVHIATTLQEAKAKEKAEKKAEKVTDKMVAEIEANLNAKKEEEQQEEDQPGRIASAMGKVRSIKLPRRNKEQVIVLGMDYQLTGDQD